MSLSSDQHVPHRARNKDSETLLLSLNRTQALLHAEVAKCKQNNDVV